MSTNNHEPNETAAPAAPGGWEPIPQSEGYDEGATAFVHLPPEFMLDGVPLEAPGHGYTPPMIVPLQPLERTAQDGADPAWPPAPAEGAEYFAPERDAAGLPEPPPHGYGDDAAATRPYGDPHTAHAPHDPHATAEWHFGATPTGQWQVPAAPAEPAPEALPDPFAQTFPETFAEPGPDSFADSYAEPVAEAAPEPVSYEQAPPTLPGGATAPWAMAAEEPADHAEHADQVEHVDHADRAEHGEPEERGEHAERGEAAAEAAPDAEAEAGGETAGPDGEPEGRAVGEPSGIGAVQEAPELPDASEAAEAPAESAPTSTSVDSDEHPHTSYVLRVNGADRPVTGSWIGESLLYVLRERLGLAGAKDGCSQGECGACNVQVDGRLVASCLVPAATAAGSEVRTVEGLATDGEPSDVQRALSRCGTVQCGFCIPGMCMTVHDLLEGNHAPTELETRQALAGNLCRCSGYRGVLQAVEDVVAERAGAAADHTAAGEDDAAHAPHPAHEIPHQHDGGRA
ncbi:2Fe-2S iron-sulfur cluster-binding protein [Streptomyces termitum]|uniref:2Fe-2S iron-sulfur cluster-binding protein n=1 Tax=Streptomyces termitum TaxID=67368 RepID=UPI003790B309